MKHLLACVLSLSVGTMGSLRSEDEAPKTSMKEMLRARIAEDAKKADPKKAAPIPPVSPAPAAAAAATGGPATAAAVPAATAPGVTSPALPAGKDESARPAAPANAAKEPATVLPKVEVRKGRITVLDQQLAKQEQDIARERKNLKVSETDTALNDSKIAKPLAIFGGESSQFRQSVASRRVELMEAEKEILEAISRAKTKEEKKELQKQLDDLKGFRRDLEKSLR